MKKLTSFFLALVIAITTFSLPVSAASSTPPIWDGSVDTSWYTGDKDSYDIVTASQLAGLSELVNSGYSMEGIVINLKDDIVFNDTVGWEDWNNNPPKNKFTPIGKSGNPVGGYYPFAGVFNGNGHSISGLYVNNPTVAGLFGYLYCATVANVIIEKSVIIGYDTESWKTKGVYAGGIAGLVEGSIINQCENDGKVYCKGGWRRAYCGGIAGSMDVENASAMTLAMALGAGGIFANPMIFNNGSGGLIKESGIYNCMTTGNVNAVANAAGEGRLGGIVGWGNNGIVQNCLTDNSINGKGIKWGRIAGGAYNCSFVNCYYYSGSTKEKALGLDWSTSVVPVKRDMTACDSTMYETDDIVKKLGDAFVYVGNTYPRLACDLRPTNKPSSGSSNTSTDTTVSSSKPAVTVENGKATITWTAVDGAIGYSVYYQKSDGKYSKLADTVKTTLNLTGIVSGKTYQIMIKAKTPSGTSKVIENGMFAFSGTSTGGTSSAAFTITPKTVVTDGKVKITWNSIDGATEYIIYQYVNGAYTKLKSTDKTTVTFSGIKSGKTYTMKIVPVNKNGTIKIVENGKFTFTA